MFQICLGISWGQPATPEAMTYMRNLLPADAPWFAFGISLHQFPMVAQAVLLGGHPRVGLEDNIYLEKGKLAPSNAALVEKAAKIIEVLGDHVATPADARTHSWDWQPATLKAPAAAQGVNTQKWRRRGRITRVRFAPKAGGYRLNISCRDGPDPDIHQGGQAELVYL